MTTSDRQADVAGDPAQADPRAQVAAQQRAVAEVVDGRPGFWRRAASMISVYLFAAGALVALLLPRLLDERTFFGWAFALTVTAAYVMYAASWDILSGFTGQVNFGQSAFIGTGGFVAAVIASRLDQPLFLVVLIATVVSALLGVVVGVPALRLTGPYLALVTLTVVTALINLTLALKEYTGGEEGVAGLRKLIDDPVLGPIGRALATVVLGSTYTDARAIDQDSYVDYLLMVLFALVVVAGLLVLGYSRRGLVLRSIQQDEMAAEAAGVDAPRYKVAAFVLSGALAGFAGAMIVAARGTAQLDLLAVTLSLLIIVMAAVGGVGTVVGPVLGAVAVGVLDLKVLSETGFIGSNPELKLGVFALALIVVVVLQPRGLLPPVQDLWRKRLRERNSKQVAAGLASLLQQPAGAGGEGRADTDEGSTWQAGDPDQERVEGATGEQTGGPRA